MHSNAIVHFFPAQHLQLRATFQWRFHTGKVKSTKVHSEIKIVKAFGNNVKSPLKQQNFIFHYINNISLNLETSKKRGRQKI